MEYRDEVFKYQYPVVAEFVQSLAYYRGLTAVLAGPTDASGFWQATTAGYLKLATVAWCKVFGSRKEDLHWTNAPTSAALDQASQDFRDSLLSKTGLTKEQWDAYHGEMRAFRDKYVVHFDLTDPFAGPVPPFDLALRVAREYQEWVRELVKPVLLGQPTLISLYEKWKVEASSVVDQRRRP